jgi:hypothetical protein
MEGHGHGEVDPLRLTLWLYVHSAVARDVTTCRVASPHTSSNRLFEHVTAFRHIIPLAQAQPKLQFLRCLLPFTVSKVPFTIYSL